MNTNIVIVDVVPKTGDTSLLAHLEQQGILAVGFGPGRVRLIPNLENSRADVELAIAGLNNWPGTGNQ